MNKISFILYTSDYELLSILNPKQKAAWVDAVFAYVMDGAAPVQNLDKATLVAFTAAKRHLEEDAEKWEDVKAKRREAGKKGNEKRWGAKQNIAKIAKIANATDAKQNIANIADNVNVNENVSSNDDDNARARVASPSSSPLPDYVTMYASVTKLAEEAKHDDSLIKHIMSTHAISRMQAIDAIDSFTSYLAAIKETTHDVRDFRQHLLNWIPKHKPTTNNQQPTSCGLTIPTPTTR